MPNRLYNKQVSPKGYKMGGRVKKMGGGSLKAVKPNQKGKAAAKRKFKVYPSAYANMYASGVCSGKITPGGKKGSRKKAAGGGMINRIQIKGFGAARR
jgi:hypothetical protein